MTRRTRRLLRAMATAMTVMTVAACATATDPEPGNPEWVDTFDGAAGSPADPDRWTADIGNKQFDGWGNNELQWYTDGSANASLDGDGRLVITADRATGGDHPCFTVPQCPYVSARLTTADNIAIRTGRVEVTATLPTDVGLLPAIWLLGTESEWPGGGEIDIAEVVGGQARTVNGSAHGPGYSDDDGPTATTDLPSDASQGFHVYAVEKTPDVVSWSVDGMVYFTLGRDDLDPDVEWVLDRPMALILNIAVGGNWPGDPDASSRFPATMVIDEVRMSGDLVMRS